MNARLAVRLLRPPVKAPVFDIPHRALQLTPIPWGKPDPVLGRMVCQNVADTTPALVVPFNPITHTKARTRLRSYGIHHY